MKRFVMLKLHFRRKQEQGQNLQEVISADIDFHVSQIKSKCFTY